jgi:rubrerythrin
VISHPFPELVTGNETHKVYHCKRCGWVSEGRRNGWAMNPKCPNCSAHGLSFVRFSLDELAVAEKLVGNLIAIED